MLCQIHSDDQVSAASVSHITAAIDVNLKVSLLFVSILNSSQSSAALGWQQPQYELTCYPEY